MRSSILCFWILVSTITSSFCQNTYPRKMILNQTDTVVVITPVQLVKINRGLNKVRMLETLNENYLARLVVSDSLNKVLTGTIETQKTVISLWKEHGKTSEEIINTLEDSMREQQRRNKRTLWGVGAGCAAAGILIGLIL